MTTGPVARNHHGGGCDGAARRAVAAVAVGVATALGVGYQHYSAACRTVWAVQSAARPGTTATLHRNSDDAELHRTAGPDGSCATNQLSDISVTSHAAARSGRAYGRTRDF